MKFSKIIGNVDEKLVHQAEEKLSQIFLELGTRYDNEYVGTGMGGDPLIFGLMYPIEHVCTLNMPTAATDGKRFYWNPKFVLKQSKIGLRIICGHEAWHSLYMHPQRRGSRNPKLWNIAVDYIVNGMVMDDFKARKMDAKENFNKHLGKFMTLHEYAELLKDPFKEGAKGAVDPNNLPTPSSVNLPNPNEDRPLTDDEKKELEKREKRTVFFYADPDLEEDMKSPEKIYDYLYSLLPKCPKCGSVGIYKPKKDKNKDKDKDNQSDSSSGENQNDNSGGNKSKKNKGSGKNKDENKEKEQSSSSVSGGDNSENENHDHDHQCGDDSCDCSDSPQDDNSCCPDCGKGFDIFDLGGTVDDHMDTEESEEKLAKRISDAMEAAKKMAGVIPAALEDELGKLTAPKITWQDIVRARIVKARNGNAKNDWTRFRTRPMFSGLLTPKRKSYHSQFACLLDTSGSMSKDDIAFGLSQLAALDERSEGVIVPCDSEVYWDKATKIRKCNVEELSKVKVVGRGGTVFGPFFSDYEENVGKCDFLIVITDGFLLDQDIVNMKNPGIDTIWLVTAESSFKPPFGRAFFLRD